MFYIAAVTPSLSSLLHQLPLCNLRASKLLIVLPHINSKSLIFMTHPTLPLDRIPAACYLFPLPSFFAVYIHTTGAVVFWSVPNDNDCCKITVIFRTLCLHFTGYYRGSIFVVDSLYAETDCHSILTQCLMIYRTGNVLLHRTRLLDDFLMTINIDSKLLSYPASRAVVATGKPDCSFFLCFKYTFAQLLSHLPASVFLFNFICKTDVFRLSCPGTKKKTVITSRLDPWKTHIWWVIPEAVKSFLQSYRQTEWLLWE